MCPYLCIYELFKERVLGRGGGAGGRVGWLTFDKAEEMESGLTPRGSVNDWEKLLHINQLKNE